MLKQRMFHKTMRRVILYRRIEKWAVRITIVAGVAGMYGAAVVLAVGG
jgi:hypothetical protein